MAQKGRSARETQEELELYRDKLARKKRRLEMVRGFLKPLLFLASGLIIGVVAFALLSSFTEERGGRAEPPPDIEATVQSRVEKALASMPKPTPEVVVKEVIVEKAAGVVSDSESVLAEDVFQDIFQNATRVDKVSIDDVKNCRVLSEYEVQLGDTVSVEVGLARKDRL